MIKPQPIDECDMDLEDIELFTRSCMESHEDAMRNGCVPGEEIERGIYEAIRLGLEDRGRDRLAMGDVDAAFERYRQAIEEDVESYL